MKTYLAFALLALLSACHLPEKDAATRSTGYPFFVGTYTDGESRGIYSFFLQEDGALKPAGLAAEAVNPSFLARSSDRRFLVAVNETDLDGTGTVESYLVRGDSLTRIGTCKSGGAHPCFATVNGAGYVLTANYTGGNVGLLRLDQNGTLSGPLAVQQHTGRGTTDRQEAPHAHSAWFFPGTDTVIAIDLGTNELWFSVLDTILQTLTLLEPSTLTMAPGAGPRHLAFHPNSRRIYVVNELDCTVTLVRKTKEGGFEAGPSISTLPSGFSGANYCADIHITRDGRFLYASNRGHNSLAIFVIGGDDGALKPLAYEPTRGEWPRNFALSPDENFVVVANQNTGNLVSFKRDPETGLLTYTSETEVPDPVCISF